MCKNERENLLRRLKPVKNLKFTENMTVSELIEQFAYIGGFTAKKIWTAVEILIDMLKDEKSVNFLSFPAAIIATGLRGAVVEMVKRGYFDIIITTCGTLDHDIARCFRDYYEGWFNVNDRELHKLNIHRLGNVFIPVENYGLIIEEFMKELLPNIEGKELSTYELSLEIGRHLDKCKRREESILWWAWKKKIPVIIPGITDGAVGYQLWYYSQDHDVKMNVLKDEQLLADIIYDAEVTGALMIGGGISKHHVIWWNQFKDGLDRVVYITTAVEWDGSLSGARIREAISWGKVSEKAKYITVEGDATVILALIVPYLINNVKQRNTKKII